MQNDPSMSGNPSLPVDAEAAKKTKKELADGEVEKSDEEKEKESHPDDAKPFNVDKVDELEKSKDENNKE
ncbi:hypothetical protein [Alkalibacterium olivapovliticus]|uniref:Uncharacterized protein n=1 Tax=Alkalibacterium olivapovliticus TaxID=99907 RepID=A0A2T0W6A4_9LACT|nr:hypothetical protein [Alkalibacterium olivapovliticus]PRY82236.1 hypothetical protein CLV38_11432 [Alkalibacterium olivapovliticus]